MNSEVEKNTLPLLEEEYSDGIGELIYNDDDEIVFDPNQEIEEGDIGEGDKSCDFCGRPDIGKTKTS